MIVHRIAAVLDALTDTIAADPMVALVTLDGVYHAAHWLLTLYLAARLWTLARRVERLAPRE